MSYTYLLTELDAGVLWITINRPDKLNALNRDVIQELSDLLDASAGNGQIRALVITGAGEKAFVAGADISEFSSFRPEEGKALARDGQQKLFDKLAAFPRPVIAAVNGFALGGGLELAMAAHVRIAADHAKMGLPEVSLGLIPGYGGTQRLPKLIGPGRAFEMIFSGKMITAPEALQYGLVNQVVPMAELKKAAAEMAASFLKNSSTAQAAAIQAIQSGIYNGEAGFQAEIDAFGSLFGTQDFKEGTTAFLEKRKPNFS